MRCHQRTPRAPLAPIRASSWMAARWSRSPPRPPSWPALPPSVSRSCSPKPAARASCNCARPPSCHQSNPITTSKTLAPRRSPSSPPLSSTVSCKTTTHNKPWCDGKSSSPPPPSAAASPRLPNSSSDAPVNASQTARHPTSTTSEPTTHIPRKSLLPPRIFAATISSNLLPPV